MTTFVPVVRSASLNGYQELAYAVGLNAHSMLRRAGLPLRSLSDPDTPLRTDAVRSLLEISAEASGVVDFGLRLAGLRQLFGKPWTDAYSPLSSGSRNSGKACKRAKQ